jgi:hypothetical protein
MKHLYLISASLLVAAVSCNDLQEDIYKGLDSETYEESTAVIPNPERGFYSTTEVHDASKAAISQAKVNAARTAGRTLHLLEYYLTDYVDCDIAEDYLTLVRNNFKALREYGAKALVRFAYSNGHSEKDRPWDATEQQVLRHVEQLKPILREYSDVIFTVQAGFVGSWGEWYYTDNFNMDPKTEEQYAPRKHLLEALLDALPENRQIEVRTPTFKMKIFGFSLADTLTAAEAHNGSIKARIAGHNDCFLASENDTGTYHSKTEKEYWKAETRYTIMGGETCADTTPFCNCEDSIVPGAVSTMEAYHFSYLHISYHPQVISRWKKENCFDQIDRRLGYRLVLKEGHFTPTAKAGEDYRIVLEMENVGFAAPMNPRDAEFVLCGKDGKVAKTWPLNSDPRTWHSGPFTIDQTVKLPEGISGEYKLFLNLPDPETTLRNNPYFSIQLANNGLWDEKTGFNSLKSITIE